MRAKKKIRARKSQLLHLCGTVAFAEHLRPRCAINENKGGAPAGLALPLPRFVKEASEKGRAARRGLARLCPSQDGMNQRPGESPQLSKTGLRETVCPCVKVSRKNK